MMRILFNLNCGRQIWDSYGPICTTCHCPKKIELVQLSTMQSCHTVTASPYQSMPCHRQVRPHFTLASTKDWSHGAQKSPEAHLHAPPLRLPWASTLLSPWQYSEVSAQG